MCHHPVWDLSWSCPGLHMVWSWSVQRFEDRVHSWCCWNNQFSIRVCLIKLSFWLLWKPFYKQFITKMCFLRGSRRRPSAERPIATHGPPIPAVPSLTHSLSLPHRAVLALLLLLFPPPFPLCWSAQERESDPEDRLQTEEAEGEL